MSHRSASELAGVQDKVVSIVFSFVIRNPVQTLHRKCCIPFNLLKRVIARERDDRLRELCRLQLEQGDAHFNAQPFRFSAARDYTTIIVTEHHNGPVAQVRTKHLFTARIERIHVSERKHQLVLRVL